ncbi:MAG: ParB/RepB/Spo0J family partition protein [Candidatus Methylomirabilia bacterium]
MAKRGLGRGLGALLPEETPEGERVQNIPLEAIKASPTQPRKSFNSNTLEELAASMRQSGVLQPVVVRRHGEGYQLIVGERRWRAAKLAGLTAIPALVREVTDAESLELAIIENLRRDDLNPMEEADAYQRLLLEYGWTQEELGQRVGKDRSSVANCLRLLKLPPLIQEDLRSGRLTMGHARALLALTSLTEQLKLREEILVESWSVRATEQGVRRSRPHRTSRRSAEVSALEEQLREALATRARIVGNERRGRIEVAYSSRDELGRLVEIIAGRRG